MFYWAVKEDEILGETLVNSQDNMHSLKQDFIKFIKKLLSDDFSTD